MRTDVNPIETVRQPEYTGANRCMACTAVNSVIAVFASGVLTLAVGRFHSTGGGIGAGVALLVVSALSIWLRGYLVPGTPALTKRYMPRWMLAWFGKETPMDVSADSENVVDIERPMLEAGIIEPCEDDDDYCLTESFREDWRAADGATVDRLDTQVLAEMLGLDEMEDEMADEFEDYEIDGEFGLERADDSLMLMYRNPDQMDEKRDIAVWPSESAARADLTSAAALSEWLPHWEEYSPYQRAMTLKSVRIFLDVCPNGDETDLTEDVVESCCSTHDVLAVVCSESGDRLVEQPVN